MDKIGWRRGDTLLAITLVAVALGIWVALMFFSGTGAAVEVTVEGEVMATLPLGRDITLEIPGAGGQNTLVIANGEARMLTADCPDGICVRHRAISRPGESILCLPHRVAVTVVGGQPAVVGEA